MNINDLLVENNEVVSKIPLNQEDVMYEENTEDDDNPIINIFNKIFEEKRLLYNQLLPC